MIVISQNGKVAVNAENILAFEQQGRYIHAHPANGGNPIPLIFCETEDDAENRFKTLIDRISTKERVIKV